MEIASCLMFRLKQILSKLKFLNIIQSYTLKIEFGRIADDLKDCLVEVNALLKKCVKKIRSKPRRAEIRNVIGELVRKKNIKQFKDVHADNEMTTAREDEEEKCWQFESGKLYLCEYCGFLYIHSSDLKSHILSDHIKSEPDQISAKEVEDDGPKPHLNSENVDYGNEVSHKENLQNSPPQTSESSLVQITPEEGTRAAHGLVHGEVESYTCPHTECPKIFKKRASLKKHIRLKHGSNTQHRCGKCEKVFSEKGKLNRHMLIHQRGQLQCLKCRQTFHRRDNLNRHLALHHENVKAFQCRFCKKKFSLRFNRDTHEVNVHKNIRIECESCGKKCKNEATLKVHKRLHEESRISCSLCCKTFTRKAHYKNHLKNKHKGLSPFQKLFDSFSAFGSN